MQDLTQAKQRRMVTSLGLEMSKRANKDILGKISHLKKPRQKSHKLALESEIKADPFAAASLFNFGTRLLIRPNKRIIKNILKDTG